MQPAVMLLLALALLSLPGGCAYQDARVADTARQRLLGTSVADLDMCAGLPSKTERINPVTEVRSYERNESSNSGLNLTFPVIGGGMTIGNGGYCHATFKVVNGQVAEVNYAGDTAVAGVEDALCAPIVRRCVDTRSTQAAGSQQTPGTRQEASTSEH